MVTAIFNKNYRTVEQKYWELSPDAGKRFYKINFVDIYNSQKQVVNNLDDAVIKIESFGFAYKVRRNWFKGELCEFNYAELLVQGYKIIKPTVEDFGGIEEKFVFATQPDYVWMTYDLRQACKVVIGFIK